MDFIGDLFCYRRPFYKRDLFAKVPSRSLGGHDYRLGRSRRNRRAMIGEGADTRQVLVRRTSHRGTSQDEGEGEDEAGGPHLTCLRLSVAGSARPLVGHLIAVRCFRTSAPKTENGFVARENCFVASIGRNIGRKNSMNSAATPSLEMVRLNTVSPPSGPLWPASQAQGRPRSPTDRMNPSRSPADSTPCNFPCAWALVTPSSTKDSRRG